MPRNPEILWRRWMLLGLVTWTAALWWSLGCGSAATPSSTTSSPIPIELPSSFTLPSSLSVDIEKVSSANLAAPLTTAKTLPGATSLEQYLYGVTKDQTRLDLLLDVLSVVSATSSESVTTASGFTDGNGLWFADFATIADFPAFSDSVLTSVDCSTACSGHTGSYPVCAQVYIRGEPVWAGKVTSPVNTTKGAGCFVSNSTVTDSSNESALFDGTKSYTLSGKWDFTDTANLQLELFSTTTAVDANGVKLTNHHVLLTQTSSGIVTTNIRGTLTDNGTDRVVQGIARGDGSKVKGDYSIAGSDLTIDVEGCLNAASAATSTTDCGESLDIASVTPVSAAAPPTVTASTFVTKPSVTTMSPARNATGVAVNASIAATFNVDMDTTTFTSSTIAVTTAGQSISGTITPAARSVTFQPSANLSTNTTYTVTVTTGITSAAAVALIAETAWSFTTGSSSEADTTAPTVTSTSPSSGATAVSVSTDIRATLSESIDNTTVTSDTFQVATGGSAVAGSFDYSNPTIIFTPTSTLSRSTVYTVSATAGIKDLASNALTASSWSFTTQNPDGGTLDTSFSADGKVATDFGGYSDYANDVAIQSDGKIVVVGYARNGSPGHDDFAVARYTTTGALDTTFSGDGLVMIDPAGTTLDDSARAVAIQSDGKIVVVGTSDTASPRWAIVRLTSAGALDTTFSSDGIQLITTIPNDVAPSDAAYDAVVDSSGNIVVVGKHNGSGWIARVDTFGSVDSTFSGDGFLEVEPAATLYGVVLDSSGRIIVAGESTNFNSDLNSEFHVARVTTTGTLDSTFGSDGEVATAVMSGQSDAAYGLALQSDGSIVVAGDTWVSGNLTMAVARYTSNGVLDTTFGSGGIRTTAITGYTTVEAFDVAVESNGSIVVVGGANNGASPRSFVVAEYSSSGSLDTTFDSDGILTTSSPTGAADFFNGVAVQSDGNIVAVGYSHEGMTINDFVVLRIWP